MNDPVMPEDENVRLTFNSERFDTLLLRLIDNPPPPGPKLKALLRRVPAWEKRTQT